MTSGDDHSSGTLTGIWKEKPRRQSWPKATAPCPYWREAGSIARRDTSGFGWPHERRRRGRGRIGGFRMMRLPGYGIAPAGNRRNSATLTNSGHIHCFRNTCGSNAWTPVARAWQNGAARGCNEFRRKARFVRAKSATTCNAGIRSLRRRWPWSCTFIKRWRSSMKSWSRARSTTPGFRCPQCKIYGLGPCKQLMTSAPKTSCFCWAPEQAPRRISRFRGR
jgi:hypothetical protein